MSFITKTVTPALPTFLTASTANQESQEMSAGYDYHTLRTETIDVTPELAREWLDWYDDNSGHAYNRIPGVVHVAHLAADMKTNRWQYTGVPIIIGTHGKVLDGRQRLEAVIVSGSVVRFDVKFGIDPEAQSSMDRVRVRRVSDDLQMENVPNASNVSATTNLILHWRSGRLLDRTATPTHAEMREFERANREQLQLASREASRVRTRLPAVTLTVVGAAFFEAIIVDEDACMRFFHAFRTGEGLEDGDPILALRNTILRYGKKKPKRHEQLFQVAHAWNLWRGNKRKTLIVVPYTLTSDSFPTMK